MKSSARDIYNDVYRIQRILDTHQGATSYDLARMICELNILNDRYEEGYDAGYCDGDRDGSDYSYDQGYRDGHDEGYDEGYDHGKIDGKEGKVA